MRKFECHITCSIKDAEIVEREGTRFGSFKFSKIDGDALLGAKPYCYLTAYEPDVVDLYTRMTNMCNHLIANFNIEILRRKVEEIVFDTKTGINNMRDF